MEKRISVQVSKLYNGLELFAWKRVGAVDPLDEDGVMFVSGGSPGDGLAAPAVAPTGLDDLVGYAAVGVADDLLWLPAGTTGPSTHEKWMMEHSLVGTKQGDKKGRWAVCYVCQSEFPQRQMIRKGGKWYCKEDAE